MLRLVVDALGRQCLGALALFIALGGTSYAFTLGAGSVGSREIRNGSVTSADIGHRQVRGRDIANNAPWSGEPSPQAR